MSREYISSGAILINETGTRDYILPDGTLINETVASGTTYTLDCAPTSFAVTAVGVTFARSIVLSASPTSFAVTPVGVTFARHISLSVSPTSFSVTPIGVLFARSIALTVSPTSFAVTPVGVTFTYTPAGTVYHLDCLPTSFSVTSVPVTFTRSIKLTVNPTSYTVGTPSFSFTYNQAAAFDLDRNIFITKGKIAFQYIPLKMSMWKTSGRPSSPKKGMFGFNTDFYSMEEYDGTKWVSISSYKKYDSTAIDLTLSESNDILEVTASGKTITLPSAIGIKGRIFTIDNSSGGDITVNTTGGQTIEGESTQTVPKDSCIEVYSNNLSWRIK